MKKPASGGTGTQIAPVGLSPKPKLNMQIASCLAGARELQQLGHDLQQHKPIESVKAETVPSLVQLARDLKDLSAHLTLRSELVGGTLEVAGKSLDNSSAAIERIGKGIVKDLESLNDVVLAEMAVRRYIW